MKKSHFLPAIGLAATLVSLPSISIAQETTVPISFDWDWEIVIQPTPTTPLPQEPIPLNLWGATTINFEVPTGLDLGTQENPLPVPMGESFRIPTEIVSMNLEGTSPTFGDVVLRQSATQPSEGAIENLTNVDGNLTASSFFDVAFELEFDDPSNPGERMTLFTADPVRVGMDFTVADEIAALDSFWIPTWIWSEFTANTPELVDEFGVPWDTVISIHGHRTTPEPMSTLGLFAFGALGAGSTILRKK
ncbi:MAG: hypothetical protein F6K48_14620 [Okeania sp. SIO3H1]|nr:hypothetical protein [Okeania sp. SIO3H1]